MFVLGNLHLPDRKITEDAGFCAQEGCLMFDHNLYKLPCLVHEHHHHMGFENVGHMAHYQQRLFLEAWMSIKDPKAGNDHMVIPEIYKCLART